MSDHDPPEAFVELPSEAQVRQARGDAKSPYDFGVIPPMGRLLMAHPRLGPAFGQLFGEVMFRVDRLTRAESEMIAGVAAAAQDCHY
jgi:hypothetical protein